MPRRNSPKDIKEIADLNRLKDIVHDKRNAKRASAKKTRRDRHYEKQFIKNTIKTYTETNPNMDKEQLLEQLKTIIKPYVKDQIEFDNLTELSDFINDLKINSANLVDVILDIEEKYNIIIDNESMERMVNVQAAMEIIKTKLSEKN